MKSARRSWCRLAVVVVSAVCVDVVVVASATVVVVVLDTHPPIEDNMPREAALE